MLATEIEALDLLCCADKGTCAGARCMAWRWGEPEPEVRYHRRLCDEKRAMIEPPRPDDLPADWVFVAAELDPDYFEPALWHESDESAERRQREELTTRRGYCGLAGKPEHG